MFINKLKGKLASAYVQYIIEKTEDITVPGFIITKLSGENSELLLRDIFLPEDLFILIENSIAEKFGEMGKLALYSAGKKGGYAYASLSNFTQRSHSNQIEFEAFGWIIMEFIGGTYASDVKVDLNTNEKRVELQFKDFIICEKNGRGYIISEGGTAGIWAYMTEDTTIEAKHLTCQGNGFPGCDILIQPHKNFKEPNLPYSITDLPTIKYSEEYQIFNQIRATEFTHLTLNELIDSQVGEYKDGKVLIKQMRHFEFDPHILYILETEICRIPGAESVLFNSSFEVGEKVMNALKNQSIQLVIDYFGALGWGDMLITGPEKGYLTNVRFYPWTEYTPNSKYIILRGMLSGMISTVYKQRIELQNFEANLSESYLSLTLRP